MLNDDKIIRLIFGFKVRHLRQQKGFSYQQLSDLTSLSTSYLNDIEKGKRYPKPDKINALATALDTDYNYLVAIGASKKLKPIIDLLTSKFFKLFPLDLFGISLEKLLELFSQTPDKVNAFISTIFRIARNYQVDEQRFYKEALRSYQDMHDNHFPDLEESVQHFKKEFSIKDLSTPEYLEEQLEEIYGINIDRKTISTKKSLKGIRSYFNPEKRILFVQPDLSPNQENFLLARELGFQYLNLAERPYETTITEVDSFEKLLNNYKASHFASALLMDGDNLVKDIRTFCQENVWQPGLLLKYIEKYNVSPETFMQRLTNILPFSLGIEDLFFIRLSGYPEKHEYSMTKDLHLSQLHSPYNNELDEHYCNRWISITALQELQELQKKNSTQILIDAQISKYWNTEREYLCITVAKPSYQRKEKLVSVTIGLLVNPELKGLIHFLKDRDLKYREVHTTCERCGVINCESRMAEPNIINEKESADNILNELKNL